MATGGLSDLERGTDETFDFLCSMCQRQKKNTEGEHFCADCSDYYCFTHVKIHDEVPALKNHKILNKAQPSASVHFPAVPTERCRVHGHKPVDMFCQQHDSVGCATCMVVQHSECKEKFYVPDFIKNNTTASNPNDITVQIDALANRVDELQNEFIKEKENLKRSKEKTRKQIQKWRIDINGLLDELENKTIQALEQRVQSLTDKIESALRELQASTTDIQSAQISLNSAGSNMAQMFVSIKMAGEVTSLTKEKITTTQCSVSSTEIYFIPHQKLQNILKKMQALGDISITENVRSMSTSSGPLTEVSMTQTSHMSAKTPSTTQSTPASLLPVATAQTRQQSKPSLLQVKGKKRYTVKVKSDSDVCVIYSVCTFTDGTIILADYKNSKLKRMNSTSYTITGCCDVPEHTWQVCTVNDQEVAVSFELKGLIQFVNILKAMTKTRKINTGFPCSSVAYADGQLYVSDSSLSVYVYSLSGARQQQFSPNESVQQIFSKSNSLAVSSDHSKIYVTDLNRGLIILDRTGRLVRQFNSPELQGACCVYLHNNDNVLVCGNYSRNVLQFTSDGKLLGEVLKTDKGCMSVCCNKDKTKLIVGLVREDENRGV